MRVKCTLYFHLYCKSRCFWRNLHRWQKFYTSAGTDGTDKFHLWFQAGEEKKWELEKAMFGVFLDCTYQSFELKCVEFCWVVQSWGTLRALGFSGFRVHSLDNRRGFQSSQPSPSLLTLMTTLATALLKRWGGGEGCRRWSCTDWWGPRWAPCFGGCPPHLPTGPHHIHPPHISPFVNRENGERRGENTGLEIQHT